MMMIQKVIKYKHEGNTYDSFSQLKQAYPYISFPVGADADVLSILGIEKVEEYPSLERCKEILKAQAGLVFAKNEMPSAGLKLMAYNMALIVQQ